MVRTRTLAVIGVVMLVALAGCGGTGTDTPANETDGGLNETDTTVGGADDTETTTEEDTTTTTEQNATTTTGQNTTDGGTGDNGSAASITLEDQSSNGSVVRVASVNLPEGGFVVLYESQNGTVTSLLANTSYIESGTQENLTIQLNNSLSEETDVIAIAHEDTDGNQQFSIADDPYLSGTDPISDEATIRVAGNATNTTTTTTTTTSS